MKPGTYPKGYYPAVLHDVVIDTGWIIRSTVQTNQTTAWEDVQTNSVYTVETSMYSNPLHRGTQHVIDTEGRVEQFNKNNHVLGALGGRRVAGT